MTDAVALDDHVLAEMRAAVFDLQRRALSLGIPIPQILALKNRAQELGDQVIELEAARFNATTQDYLAAIDELSQATAALRSATRDLEDAVEILDKAGQVFKVADKVMKKAANFLPIGF